MLADVRVFEPGRKSYENLEPDQHERQKKLEYNDRANDVERGTLAPLIISTTEGWDREATRFHKQLARLIAEKYGYLLNFIRKIIRFCLLRTILESLI